MSPFNRCRVLVLGCLLVAWAALPASPATGHGPDPTVGGSRWALDQVVGFRWKSGQVPPSWMQTAIRAAADDSNASRASRAATFRYDASAPSTISYDEPTGCGVNGLACFNRGGAPTSFTMSFRRQGYAFDWGPMRWCEYYSSPPDGCYEAENIALDEFGHVELLGHHVNNTDSSDYRDAVVQTYSRTKPKSGWNAHVYGPCDTATLQLKYDVPSWTTRYSTCLDLATTLTLSASDTSVAFRGAVTFTASLRVAASSSYELLSNNPLSGRAVVLQRRIDATTWFTYGAMTAGPSSGTYTLTVNPSASAAFRVVYTASSSEGLRSDTSPLVSVDVGPCEGLCVQSKKPLDRALEMARDVLRRRGGETR